MSAAAASAAAPPERHREHEDSATNSPKRRAVLLALTPPSHQPKSEFMVKTEASPDPQANWTSKKLFMEEEDAEAQSRRWRCIAAAPRFHYDVAGGGDSTEADRYRMQNLSPFQGNFFPALDDAALMGRAEALVDIGKHPASHPGHPGHPGHHPGIKHHPDMSGLHPGMYHHPMGSSQTPTAHNPASAAARSHMSQMDLGHELIDPLCPSNLPPLGMTTAANTDQFHHYPMNG
ncbi:uncharacterized protein LOC111272225 [Varroa jacobsoni]|uniref:uncharacterized protein LOC111272225 n=1 Tax=Varroa jacobsoni TaxID=62625 RepID=UPI000BF7DB1C|nr:uncharacterized protein LOC111272225 [Varroa jacobsoni]